MQSSRESSGYGSESVLQSTVIRRSIGSNSCCLAFLVGDLLQLAQFHQQTNLFCFIISFPSDKQYYPEHHVNKACFKRIFWTDRLKIDQIFLLPSARPADGYFKIRADDVFVCDEYKEHYIIFHFPIIRYM